MQLIYTARISTWIAALVRAYVRSGPPAVSWACGQCGLNLDARVTDGICGSTLEINYSPQNLSPSKWHAVLTLDEKLLISCACSPSVAPRYNRRSGDPDGTSCLAKNSAKTQREAIYTADDWRLIGMTIYNHAQACGCDPVADHMCEHHHRTVNALKE